MDINQLSNKIIGAAIEVHKTVGPGLLESAYERCLCRELALCGISFKNQVPYARNARWHRTHCEQPERVSGFFCFPASHRKAKRNGFLCALCAFAVKK
jgi:hypothetical protein